jgi:nucleoside-diphosphate-sugar epimerase
MRLLITGVSGFVAIHTARTAILAGHEVIAVGREPLSSEMKALGVKEFIWSGWPTSFTPGGLSELIAKFGRLDSVIHIAGDASYGNGHHYHEANVTPTSLLVNSIISVDPTIRFVLASSVGAQDFQRFRSMRLHNEESKPSPKSDYGRSKLEAEKVVIRSGLDYAVARLGMVIGRGMRLNSHVAVLMDHRFSPLASKILSLFGGMLPLVHVNDAAQALLMLAQSSVDKGTYLVVAANVPLKSILNFPSPRQQADFSLSFGWLAVFLPAKFATALSPVMTFDSSKLRAIGWTPTLSSEEAINDVRVYLQDLSREVHVVTGVASGLGRAIMEELVNAGAQVIGVDRNFDVISEMRDQYVDSRFLCADVSDPNLFSKVQTAADDLGASLTSLFLIAGTGLKSTFIDHDFNNIRLQFEVNVMARLSLAQSFLQNLSQLEQAGRLLIVSSSTALQPLPGFAVYGATNAALLSFGRALITETSHDKCQIMICVPGGMNTNFQKTAGVRRLQNEKLLDPYLVAQTLLRSTSKKSGVKIIGRNARAAHIISRFLPWSIADYIWAKITALTR